MKTRKLILVSAIAVLAVAFGLELVFSGGTSIKALSLSGTPDTILISKGSGNDILLRKEGDRWTLGEKRYPADDAQVDPMLKALGELKVLDTVSSGGDDGRYGLSGADGLAVTVKQGEKVLRRLAIGKAAGNSGQTYLHLDGAVSVALVSGNLAKIFGKTIDELRNREIFTIKESDVSAIELGGKESWALSKSTAPVPPADPTAVPAANASAKPDVSWSITAPASEKKGSIDREKFDGWLSSVLKLRATSFAPEGQLTQGTPLEVVSFNLGSRTATVSILAKEGDKYLCSSSESPWPFYLSGYIAERYMKGLKDLTAK